MQQFGVVPPYQDPGAWVALAQIRHQFRIEEILDEHGVVLDAAPRHQCPDRMPFALLLRRPDQFVDPETAVGEVVAPPEDVLGAALVEQRRAEIARLPPLQPARPPTPAPPQPP